MYSELQASLINADEESSAARDAASSASALLGANGGLPEAHWGVVVYDCASILLPSAEASAEAKLIGIGKDETYSLLKALETVSASTGAHRDSLLEGLRQRNITADPVMKNPRASLEGHYWTLISELTSSTTVG